LACDKDGLLFHQEQVEAVGCAIGIGSLNEELEERHVFHVLEGLDLGRPQFEALLFFAFKEVVVH